jgi:hypothetical protein
MADGSEIPVKEMTESRLKSWYNNMESCVILY